MKISFETISRLTDRDPHSSLHGQSDWATAPPERGLAPKRRGATAMTLALAILAIAALARGCGRPDKPEVGQYCAEFRMAVPQDRFRDHDLRVADPAAGSASVGDRGSRSIHLCPDSIAGCHRTLAI